jgi:hypothetical protein
MTIHRGPLKSAAKIFILNPSGTVGRNPFGGFPSSAGFVADLDANGAGSSGFLPLVTCARSAGAMINPNSKLAVGAIRCMNRTAFLLSTELAPTLLFMCASSKKVSPDILMSPPLLRFH